MNEIPNSKKNRFGHLGLKIGICLGFGIWDLEFAILTPVTVHLEYVAQLRRT